MIDEWKEVLAVPGAGQPLRRCRLAGPGPPADTRGLGAPLGEDQREETVRHADAVGVPLDELARRRGTTPFDLLCDLALDDGMATGFRIVLENDGDDEIGDLLADKRTILGLSDAGAHATQLCDACYSTHLLGHWVHERKALCRRTPCGGSPAIPTTPPRRRRGASCGRASTPASSPSTPAPWGRRALSTCTTSPAADRLVVRSTGVEHVWVNGVAIRHGGEDVAGAAPEGSCGQTGVPVNERLMVRRNFFIGGRWEPPAGAGHRAVISPSTEEAVGTVPEATAADIDRRRGARAPPSTTGPGRP